MTVGFTGSDLVEVAVQMERNGAQFYAKVADSITDGRAKDVLDRLARDEMEHLRLFERLLATVGGVEMHESFRGEYELYLKAHVESQVFTKARMDELLGRKVSEDEALQFGIDSEKGSILYYTDMMRVVPARDQRTIEGIILEERKHLAQLVGLRKAAGG